MKTNITTDNYEAYLLDYLEGNLSPDEAEQLKTFVATQGMDWDKLTEELPHLEAPDITYLGKESLKKKAAVVPLYVKIASVAAAAGLLLTVSLWPEKSMPKMEPVAELKPIEVSHIDTHEPITMLPRRATESIDPLPRIGLIRDDMLSEGHIASERETMPLLAELPTKTVTTLQTDLHLANFDEPDFELLFCRMNENLAYPEYEANTFSVEADDNDELSLIGKAIFKMTDGHHDNFASLISSGLNTTKKEISLAATDMALTAYHRTNEHFEEAKEHWEEKLGE